MPGAAIKGGVRGPEPATVNLGFHLEIGPLEPGGTRYSP